MIIQKIKQLLKPDYETLNRIEINRQSILHNVNVLRNAQPQAQMIPVLKANAYGHGLKEISLILNQAAVEMVAVDSFPEAQIVYRYFKGKVLLIGEMPLEAYKYLNWRRTEICIYNQSTLAKIASVKKNAKVHLFINSGMNREGIKDLPSFWNDNQKYLEKVCITGLCSHLAYSQEGGEMNEKQLKFFLENLDFAEEKFKSLKYIHLGNSAAVFTVNHPRLNAFRPGLSLYGYNPFSSDSPYFLKANELKPALELFSKIISIQSLLPGESVSYDLAYIADSALKIVTIPFGYYEGLDRRLSNLASFKFKDQFLPIAGNVCMNLTSLVLLKDMSAEIGEEVQIISADNKDLNSLINLASLEEAVIYEPLVKLQANIRRIIIDK